MKNIKPSGLEMTPEELSRELKRLSELLGPFYKGVCWKAAEMLCPPKDEKKSTGLFRMGLDD